MSGSVEVWCWCFSTPGLVPQGSRIDEQRCEFPLPLKVPLHLKLCLCVCLKRATAVAFCLFQSQYLTVSGELPLILPSKSAGYWTDPPVERLVDVSPTTSQSGLHPESYDIMERDGEAKIYHRFFRSRVSPTAEGTRCLPSTGVSIPSSFPPEPSLVHSRGSLPGAPGSVCVPGGGGEQAAGDTEVLTPPLGPRAE